MGTKVGERKHADDFKVGQVWMTSCGRPSSLAPQHVRIVGVDIDVIGYEARIKYKANDNSSDVKSNTVSTDNWFKNWRLVTDITVNNDHIIELINEYGDHAEELDYCDSYDDAYAIAQKALNDEDDETVKAIIYKAYEQLEKEVPKLKVTKL